MRVTRADLQPAITVVGGIAISIANSGRFPADAQVRSALKYNARRTDDTPAFSAPAEHKFVWPNLSEDVAVNGSEPLTGGQFEDVKAKVGFIYVRTEIVYGDHFTKLCEWFSIRGAAEYPNANNPPDELAKLGENRGVCTDPSTNDAN
jgi:hypothetical protein